MNAQTASALVLTVELRMLAFSVILGLVHLVLAAQLANGQYGLRWAASPRDEVMPPLTGLAGRVTRAFRNYLETFPFFAAAVLMAHLMHRHSGMTEWGARLYFWARLAYVPLYASGIPGIRSLAWNVATLGIVLVLIALF